MPLTAELNPESLILTFEVSGDFGVGEIESIQSITQEHARTSDLKGMLLDARNASPEELPSAPIRAAAQRSKGFEATLQLKMAILVATDVAFGISRMYELLRGDDGRVQVYRDLDSALAWLGNDDPEA